MGTKDKQLLKAHRSILAYRSPVFLAMLKTLGSTGILECDDFDHDIMKELLRYIYCNEVDGLNGTSTRQLVIAAEKYKLEGLKKVCMYIMSSTLTRENVLESLTIANQLSKSEKLIKDCLDVVA